MECQPSNNISVLPGDASVHSLDFADKLQWIDDGPPMTKMTCFSHELSLVSALSFLLLLIVVARWTTGQALALRSLKKEADDEKSWTTTHAVSTFVLFMLAVELPIMLTAPKEGLVDLIQGRDPLLNDILDRVPAIQQGPSPPMLLRNRHIQFIPFLIQNEIHRLQGIPFQRMHVDVSECINKMEGCHTPQMNDTITLDIFPPFDNDSERNEYSNNFNKSSPIIIFAPGLRCHSQDLPGNSIIRKAYGSGFRSIVVNRRGHTPNQRLKSPRWNLFGSVDDMEQVYWYIKEELVSPDTAFFLHGISSGTAVTVTALSKWDKRRVEEPHRKTPVFVASVDVTPGYDISKVLSRERFLWPYNDVLMPGVKDWFISQNEEMLRQHDNEAVDKMLEATSLQEIVDHGVIFAGYDNTSHYYMDTNPINEVRDIDTPKLVLNSVDDPCCNIENLYETSPYPHHEGKTFAQMIRETKRGMVAVTHTGSHIPFICTRGRWFPFVTDPLTNGWMLNSWANEVAIDYYRAALDVYGSRRFG